MQFVRSLFREVAPSDDGGGDRGGAAKATAKPSGTPPRRPSKKDDPSRRTKHPRRPAEPRAEDEVGSPEAGRDTHAAPNLWKPAQSKVTARRRIAPPEGVGDDDGTPPAPGHQHPRTRTGISSKRVGFGQPFSGGLWGGNTGGSSGAKKRDGAVKEHGAVINEREKLED